LFSAGAEDVGRVVDLLLDDRRIWSFRMEDAAPEPEVSPGLFRLEWPRALQPYLVGVGTFTLCPTDDDRATLTATGRFAGSDAPLRFEDPYGMGLIVTKFGRIGQALSDYDPGIITRLLDHLDQVRDTVAERTGLDVYIMGGTLLGPYRDGRILPYDDDADLGYLSRHSHPVDVVREAFHVGRQLCAAGLEAVRLSGGHVQVNFTHEGRPDAYVDVFTGWVDDFGWWQHTFAVRTRARRDQVVPTITLDVEGRPEPAPREPEIMLEANYGPGWKVPDPSFRFDIPQDTQNRFWAYFGDHGMDRPLWEDHYRYDVVGDRVPLGSTPSDYARWLAERLDPDSPVLELGAGRGHDSLWLARMGHRVEALDYVRGPMTQAASAAVEQGLQASFRTLNLYDLRRGLALGAEIAARREPVVVYGRGLLGTLWDTGRPQLLRLLSMVLRSGGRAYLDVPRVSLAVDPGTGVPLHRAVSLDVLAAEMAPYGLAVDELHEADEIVEHMPWTGDSVPLPTVRMVVSWQRRTR
jgi:SAM-dependent methyltransferase